MDPTKNDDGTRPQQEHQTSSAPKLPLDPQGEPDWDTRPDLQEEEDRRELSKRWGQDLPDGGRELRLKLWREGGGF